MNSGWDFDILGDELEDLTDFDAEFYGFEIDFSEDIEGQPSESENIYTSKVDVPQYEPSGENVELDECLDKTKYIQLVDEIEKSNITDKEKAFLRLAAARHFVFSYKKIADYYASKANSEMQKLMEKSALVIIDYDDAIKNGYAVLRKTVVDLMQEEGYEA